jgi:hypothetical protein
MKLYSRFVFCLALLAVTCNSLIVHAQQGLVADNPTALLRVGDKVLKVNDAISMVEGLRLPKETSSSTPRSHCTLGNIINCSPPKTRARSNTSS